MIPGVFFAGGMDGILRAVSPTDGSPIWEFDTAKDFKTINGVAAKGGSIGAGGPTLAGGMLFVGSGYVGFQNGVPGNVLLAFAPWVPLLWLLGDAHKPRRRSRPTLKPSTTPRGFRRGSCRLCPYGRKPKRALLGPSVPVVTSA